MEFSQPEANLPIELLPEVHGTRIETTLCFYCPSPSQRSRAGKKEKECAQLTSHQFEAKNWMDGSEWSLQWSGRIICRVRDASKDCERITNWLLWLTALIYSSKRTLFFFFLLTWCLKPDRCWNHRTEPKFRTGASHWYASGSAVCACGVCVCARASQ